VKTVPVLEIGGTHVSAAVVEPSTWTVASKTRLTLNPRASADRLLGQFITAGGAVPADPGSWWGVAMPDPFDYDRGIGRFEGVAKFESLNGVDVGTALRDRLRPKPGGVAFLNDADAFALGEWTAGAASGAHRCVGVTLGTGIGSGWLVDGQVTDPGNPPGGRAHRLRVDGQPLEDAVSRRAIRHAFAEAGGDAEADVRAITEAARNDDDRAAQVLRKSFRALGAALAPVIAEFGADLVVIGGSMSRSWDLFEPWFREGAGEIELPTIRCAAHPETAPLVGAAVHALRAAN
jgi:predicted NBD/HSP70 family sugar kinase